MYGGKILVKIQLIRNEEQLIDEVMNNCSSKVLELQHYITTTEMALE